MMGRSLSIMFENKGTADIQVSAMPFNMYIF